MEEIVVFKELVLSSNQYTMKNYLMIEGTTLMEEEVELEEMSVIEQVNNGVLDRYKVVINIPKTSLQGELEKCSDLEIKLYSPYGGVCNVNGEMKEFSREGYTSIDVSEQIEGSSPIRLELTPYGNGTSLVLNEEVRLELTLEDEEGELEHLEIETLPNKTRYLESTEFDSTGMKVKGTYSNNTYRYIEEYEIDNKLLTLEDNSIKISYLGKEVSLELEVYSFYEGVEEEERRENEILTSPRVNLRKQSLVYNRELTHIGENSYRINVGQVYHSDNEVVDSLNKECGKGWSLTTSTRLLKQEGENNQYRMIDGEGKSHEFVLYDEARKRYYEKDNASILLEELDNEVKVSDLEGNYLLFNDEGLLINEVSGLNENIKKVYEYDINDKLIM